MAQKTPPKKSQEKKALGNKAVEELIGKAIPSSLNTSARAPFSGSFSSSLAARPPSQKRVNTITNPDDDWVGVPVEKTRPFPFDAASDQPSVPTPLTSNAATTNPETANHHTTSPEAANHSTPGESPQHAVFAQPRPQAPSQKQGEEEDVLQKSDTTITSPDDDWVGVPIDKKKVPNPFLQTSQAPLKGRKTNKLPKYNPEANAGEVPPLAALETSNKAPGTASWTTPKNTPGQHTLQSAIFSSANPTMPFQGSPKQNACQTKNDIRNAVLAQYATIETHNISVKAMGFFPHRPLERPLESLGELCSFVPFVAQEAFSYNFNCSLKEAFVFLQKIS